LWGANPKRPYLDQAWRYLLLNHPHDSICGCSIDQVHRDMLYRFDQARLLAEDALDAAAEELLDRVVLPAFHGGDYAVTVFNAGIAPTGPVTILSFELPTAVAARKAAEWLSPCLLDETGQPINYQTLQIEHAARARPFLYKDRGVSPAIWRRSYPVDRYTVAAAISVPPLGYKIWRLAFRRSPSNAAARECAPAPVRTDSRHGVMENEWLRCRFHADGRLDLYDKTTCIWFRNLHAFEDCGDAGDGWNHVYPTHDVRVLSSNAAARRRVRVRFLRHGPWVGTVEVAMTLRVPADLVGAGFPHGSDKSATARSNRLVPLPITTVLP